MRSPRSMSNGLHPSWGDELGWSNIDLPTLFFVTLDGLRPRLKGSVPAACRPMSHTTWLTCICQSHDRRHNSLRLDVFRPCSAPRDANHKIAVVVAYNVARSRKRPHQGLTSPRSLTPSRRPANDGGPPTSRNSTRLGVVFGARRGASFALHDARSNDAVARYRATTLEGIPVLALPTDESFFGMTMPALPTTTQLARLRKVAIIPAQPNFNGAAVKGKDAPSSALAPGDSLAPVCLPKRFEYKFCSALVTGRSNSR